MKEYIGNLNKDSTRCTVELHHAFRFSSQLFLFNLHRLLKQFVRLQVLPGLSAVQTTNHNYVSATLETRLPFPDSVGGIFPGPATTQKVYQGIECFFPVGGATMIDSFEHVD